MNKSIPQHSHSDFANTTHDWLPMDERRRWLRNCADPVQRKLLSQHGWLPEREITYCLNSQGFRSIEFNQEPSVLCLGCSHTMGIGLPVEETWPSVLQQRLQMPCWNLGVAGAAMDTVVRLADYYVHYLNVVAVLCLVPESNRFELFVDGEPMVQSAMDHSPQFGLWVLDARNARTNQEKNLLAVGKICDTVNVPFIHIFSEHTINQKSKARDLQHYGHETQCAWADQFITGYDVARKKTKYQT